MVTNNDKAIVRELARKYMSLVCTEKQGKMFARFKDTNELKATRPPVLLDEIPWYQMNMDNELTCVCEDKQARDVEYHFRKAIFYMKNTFKILILAVIALTFCVLLASCGTSGSVGTDDTADTGGSGNTVITETTNDAAEAEITKLSVGYLTEEAYNNGNFSEEAISKTVDFADRETRYMVVDLKIKTLIANSGERSVKITAQTSSASILQMMIQDAPTGKLEPFGNREGYHLVYSIPTAKGEERAVRMILKLIPSNNSGDANVSVSISGADDAAVSGKTGAASATFHIPSNRMRFQQCISKRIRRYR